MPQRWLELPPQAPRTHARLGPWFGQLVLRVGGWKMTGEFADLPRAVLIAAPHSTGWDAIWGLAAKLAMNLEIRFLAKAELFFFPIGWLLRKLGAIPIDRSAAQGSVGQAIASLNRNSQEWFLVAPEGTRKHVTKWKTGFWHIARGANVPVICAAFDYPTKTITIGPAFELTEDREADIARLREWYRPFRGLRRDTC